MWHNLTDGGSMFEHTAFEHLSNAFHVNKKPIFVNFYQEKKEKKVVNSM